MMLEEINIRIKLSIVLCKNFLWLLLILALCPKAITGNAKNSITKSVQILLTYIDTTTLKKFIPKLFSIITGLYTRFVEMTNYNPGYSLLYLQSTITTNSPALSWRCFVKRRRLEFKDFLCLGDIDSIEGKGSIQFLSNSKDQSPSSSLSLFYQIDFVNLNLLPMT